MTGMHRSRYRRILWFFSGILLNFFWWDILLPLLGLRKLSRRSMPARMQKAAARFRIMAIQMGGVMIKVGQFLSARLDVLPRQITEELAGLQDEVAPESFANVRKVIEAEFGVSLEEKFAEIEPVPIAAASIGQVHRARLRVVPGEDAPCPPVVVKVQRPDIQQIVEVDLEALRVVGRWIYLYRPIRKRANVPALLEEFSRSLREEIDYLAEGKNAETFAENFKDREDIRVPGVCWSHTTRRVLTLEDVQGIKITDYEAIEAAGLNRAEVAERLLGTYLKQIFEDRFFHADPHPGNLFVEKLPSEIDINSPVWRLTFVDFGMVGRVPDNLFSGMREMLIALGTQDAGRMIKAYQMMGILLPGADIELMERAASRVFERFWGKSTTQMMDMHGAEAQQFIDEFGELMYEIPFQAPENIILLVRCVSILSGMCTGLNADFNVWTSLAPYAQKLVEAEAGGDRWKVWLKGAGKVLQTLVALPTRADTLLRKAERGELEVRDPALRSGLARLEQSQRRVAGAVVFAAFLFTSVQLYLGERMELAAGFAAAALLTLGWMMLRR